MYSIIKTSYESGKNADKLLRKVVKRILFFQKKLAVLRKSRKSQLKIRIFQRVFELFDRILHFYQAKRSRESKGLEPIVFGTKGI